MNIQIEFKDWFCFNFFVLCYHFCTITFYIYILHVLLNGVDFWNLRTFHCTLTKNPQDNFSFSTLCVCFFFFCLFHVAGWFCFLFSFKWKTFLTARFRDGIKTQKLSVLIHRDGISFLHSTKMSHRCSATIYNTLYYYPILYVHK